MNLNPKELTREIIASPNKRLVALLVIGAVIAAAGGAAIGYNNIPDLRQPSTTSTHIECRDEKAVRVAGTGTNIPATDADCAQLLPNRSPR